MMETIQGVYHQAEDTATAVTSLSADVKRCLEEPRQPCSMPDMVSTFQRTMESVLQKYTNQASDAHKGRAQTELVSCTSIDVAERNTPRQELNATLVGPHYHTKRKFLCRTSVITVSRTISIADVQLKEREEGNGMEKTREVDHSYRHITTLEILMDLGLWRRGLRAVIGCPRRPCTSDLDLRLSTYHIVDEKAPVFQAAKLFDIETVRTLFTSGRASPFDQTTQGYSLFDWVFNRLCESYMDDTIRGLELLKFLFNCGAVPTSLTDKPQPGNFSWIEIALCEGIPLENQQTIAEATRLIFQTSSQDPISNWDVGLCMTLKSQRTPVGEAIRQQNQWPVELRPVRHEYWGVVENDRQILEDEDGLLIAPRLMEMMDYTAVNPTTIRGWDAPLGIYSILHLYHYSDLKEEIRTGCRNRITILLKAGSDPRALSSCPFDRWKEGDLEMSITQYSLLTNTFDLWQEALENLGWSRADVEGLLDEEQYLGVPELLSGELEFRSQAENREEFLQIIATGGYGEDSEETTATLATYLHMFILDVQRTVDEGYRAFQVKSTPGSWHEDEVLNLVLGIDFFIWGDWECYASFNEYDRGYC
jgi:hypothetical protein